MFSLFLGVSPMSASRTALLTGYSQTDVEKYDPADKEARGKSLDGLRVDSLAPLDEARIV